MQRHETAVGLARQRIESRTNKHAGGVAGRHDQRIRLEQSVIGTTGCVANAVANHLQEGELSIIQAGLIEVPFKDRDRIGFVAQSIQIRARFDTGMQLEVAQGHSALEVDERGLAL